MGPAIARPDRRQNPRDSFYRFQELYGKGSELALQELSRGKPILEKRVAPEAAQAVVAIAID